MAKNWKEEPCGLQLAHFMIILLCMTAKNFAYLSGPTSSHHRSIDLSKFVEASEVYNRAIEERVPQRIDIFYQPELVDPTSSTDGGLIAFSLCNFAASEPPGLNSTFLVVVDRKGDVLALHAGAPYENPNGQIMARHWEAFKPFNSSTFMMIGHLTGNPVLDQLRIQLWNFKTGRTEFVPYNGSDPQLLDSHDIIYIPETESFIVQESPGDQALSRLINWSWRTRQTLWEFDFASLDLPEEARALGMHINKLQLVDGGRALLANSRNQGCVYLLELGGGGDGEAGAGERGGGPGPPTGRVRAVYGGAHGTARFVGAAGEPVDRLWERFTHNVELFEDPPAGWWGAAAAMEGGGGGGGGGAARGRGEEGRRQVFVAYDNAAGFGGTLGPARFLEYTCEVTAAAAAAGSAARAADEEGPVCRETWSWSTGSRHRIFGDADRTPAGNVAGPAWGEVADPPARGGYHAHVYEVARSGELAWSLSVLPHWLSWMGADPAAPYNRTQGEAPIGWAMYSSENVYSFPILKIHKVEMNSPSDAPHIELELFNTHRTSHDSEAYLTITAKEASCWKEKPEAEETHGSTHINSSTSGLVVYTHVVVLKKMWMPAYFRLDNVACPTCFEWRMKQWQACQQPEGNNQAQQNKNGVSFFYQHQNRTNDHSIDTRFQCSCQRIIYVELKNEWGDKSVVEIPFTDNHQQNYLRHQQLNKEGDSLLSSS